MTGVAHRRVHANAIDLHLAEAGREPPVVFVHGFPELWYSWRHQLPAEAEAATTGSRGQLAQLHPERTAFVVVILPGCVRRLVADDFLSIGPKGFVGRRGSMTMSSSDRAS